MKTYIALLRGINVGGHKKIPMAELRALLTNFGFKNVQTYIQSGNVIFQSNDTNTLNLENYFQKLIIDNFGFDVSVLVRTREQLITIFNKCPLSEQKRKESYFALLSKVPETNLVKEAYLKFYENEEYAIEKDCIYFYCANGYGKAKFNLNFFERKLKVSATSRNYKTMIKLLSLSENL